MKFSFLGFFIIFLLASRSAPKEEIPVAGELICTAAGIDKEECINAAKINENNEEDKTSSE